MKLSYYPGCSLEGTAGDYDQSVKEVCRLAGIELNEIPDWNCCGASSAHMTNHEVGIRLPLRNLVRASHMGDSILVPCAACFQRLKAAEKAALADPEYWDVPRFRESPGIVHISSLLSTDEVLAAFRERLQGDLGGLKVACYYGCLSLRNPRVTDAPNWETPDNLERVVSALGASPVNWSHRTECCSGSLTMARPDIAERLVADIVAAARRGGAEAMVTDCPMCQANVESRQAEGGERLPVYYITELIVAAVTGRHEAKQQKAHLVPAGILQATLAKNADGKEETR